MPKIPPVTRYLLIANVLVFALQQLLPGADSLALVANFALWPLGPSAYSNVAGFEPWQLVTYAFMHGGFEHILFNMFALYMFGGVIEQTFGARNYTIYYFVCAIVAAVAQLLVVKYFTHGFYPTIGASGALFGLLLAFGMLYPQEKMFLLFLPIPMPAWLFVIGYAVVELVLGVTGTQAGVAHFAHLGGMVGGWIAHRFGGRPPSGWRGRR